MKRVGIRILHWIAPYVIPNFKIAPLALNVGLVVVEPTSTNESHGKNK